MSSDTIHIRARVKPAAHRHYHPDMPQAARSDLAEVFVFKGECANPDQYIGSAA
ncbi:MAG: hypothetical protein RXR20_22575 [Paraburkholderia sp.]|uniref:hypothetical protein n=1 Tax=Burkholderiaceae TaxID=119060 RepID=UPI001484F40F|nr:hypothetical protein [Burkholderia sp. 4M9327F10]